MFRNTLLAATAIAFTLPAFAATTSTTGADAAKPAAAVSAPHKKLHKKHVQKQAEAAAQSTTK
jgi:hypothetical protein